MNPIYRSFGTVFSLAIVTGIASAQTANTDKLAVKLLLSDGQTTVIRSRRELGFQLAPTGSPTLFAIDPLALQAALTRLSSHFQHQAVSARVALVNKQVMIVPGAYARKLDAAQTAQVMIGTVTADPTVTRFSVALTKTPPALTPEKLAGITGILGQMTTHTSAIPKRNINIRIASEAIHGAFLAPGEMFSLNAVVGERTQARGYRTATVFVDGEKVPGVGGGVSQVTGTLFNAAALAGLQIKEVHPHSRPVAYLPLGRDATVAYGAKDLKFVNNTKSPIYITYTFQGNILHAILFGFVINNRNITLIPRINHLSDTKIRAELYRIIRLNGHVVTKERLFRHLYSWKPGT